MKQRKHIGGIIRVTRQCRPEGPPDGDRTLLQRLDSIPVDEVVIDDWLHLEYMGAVPGDYSGTEVYFLRVGETSGFVHIPRTGPAVYHIDPPLLERP